MHHLAKCIINKELKVSKYLLMLNILSHFINYVNIYFSFFTKHLILGRVNMLFYFSPILN